ncbi:hypothetical protein M422DRAFT_263475 [Sphaerobolus stellatus SS14]|uniref:Uncharacterized protein n=1 Tax=Sphaerobolus stellatus (strain SS14) TaxID=990650 RepID=A0A0C9VB40_SPHS4|nr:hypothetical protein M422DRAFT_263475 [Sphaerobolus stellatus SS14]
MASPVFFIKKKDGTLRLVQDYQSLNGITIVPDKLDLSKTFAVQDESVIKEICDDISSN